MATTTTRLGLRKPAGADQVNVTTDLDNNYDLLDNAAGALICTSSTRPSAPFSGQFIHESDTHNNLTSNASAPASGSWRHATVPVVSALAQVVAPYTNQLVVLSTDGFIYRYTGTGWVAYSSTKPVFSGYSSAALSVPTGFATVPLNSENFDSHNAHDLVTNPSRWTCPVAGYYTVSGVLNKDTNWTTGNWAACIYKNGVIVPRGAQFLTSASSLRLVTPTRQLFLAVNDYIELACYQDTGVAQSLIVIDGASAGLDISFQRS